MRRFIESFYAHHFHYHRRIISSSSNNNNNNNNDTNNNSAFSFLEQLFSAAHRRCPMILRLIFVPII